jgi:hypothetical protein
MGQVTIYLDSETEKKMGKILRKQGLSKSKWIANLIREKSARTWPETVRILAGAWEDLPANGEIRNSMGVDAPREPV